MALASLATASLATASLATASRAAASLAVAALALALAGSCAMAGDYGTILSANRLHREGRYGEAASLYLGLHEAAWAPVINYDLANSWAGIGESKAAASLYLRALREGDPATRAMAAYNLGVLDYGRGDYESAWKAFKEALKANPRDQDARGNLELSWRAWKKEGASPLGSPAPVARGRGEGKPEILNLFRRLETGSWRPGTGADPRNDVRDW